MKIYTKAGDKGKTRLIGGCLVSKSDLRIEAYGSVDELNSSLGLLIVELEAQQKFSTLRGQLQRIQNELFNIGSLFACEDLSMLNKLPSVTNLQIEKLEFEIDQMSAVLTPLKNFILPGGSRSSALCHIARTICRRAERQSVKLFDQQNEIENGMVYLNRLSDYLFTAARFCNHHLGIPDQAWEK